MKIINTKIYDSHDLTICLISDIHYRKHFNLKILNKIIEKISLIMPNYICITGDIIDSSIEDMKDDIKYLYQFIDDLAKISKVIITLGNHDITYNYNKYRYPINLVDEMKKINNVLLLDNDIYIDGNCRFMGYCEGFDTIFSENGFEKIIENNISKLTKNIDNSYYNILLSHNPFYVSRKKVYENVLNSHMIDLVLAGHAHNSLLPTFIKTNTAIITPNLNFFVKNAIGHFKISNTHFVVSGGITKLSKTAGKLSLFNFLFTPVIDCIKIKRH